jgi:hypothetical protein
LETYRLKNDNLTRRQKYELVKETLHLKSKQFTTVAVIAGIIAVVFIVVWAASWVLERHGASVTQPSFVGTLAGPRTILSAKDGIVPALEIGNSGVRLQPKAIAGRGYGSFEALEPFLRDTDFLVESVDGEIKVSIKILNRQGNVVAEIVRNEWKVAQAPTAWDRNYNRDSLEVKDNTGQIVLQVRVSGDCVKLQAKPFRRNGERAYIMQSNGIRRPKDYALLMFKKPTESDDCDPNLIIQPIFRYPSELHLGELVSTSVGRG